MVALVVAKGCVCGAFGHFPSPQASGRRSPTPSPTARTSPPTCRGILAISSGIITHLCMFLPSLRCRCTGWHWWGVCQRWQRAPPRGLATKSEQPTWPTRVRIHRAGPPTLCSLMPRCRAHCPLLARTVAQRRCLLDTRHECLRTAQISLAHKRNTHHAIHHLQPKQRQRSPRSSGRQAKGPSRPLLQLAKPQSPCGRGREDRLGQVTRAAHPRPPPSQTWGLREMPQGLAHRK